MASLKKSSEIGLLLLSASENFIFPSFTLLLVLFLNIAERFLNWPNASAKFSKESSWVFISFCICLVSTNGLGAIPSAGGTFLVENIVISQVSESQTYALIAGLAIFASVALRPKLK